MEFQNSDYYNLQNLWTQKSICFSHIAKNWIFLSLTMLAHLPMEFLFIFFQMKISQFFSTSKEALQLTKLPFLQILPLLASSILNFTALSQVSAQFAPLISFSGLNWQEMPKIYNLIMKGVPEREQLVFKNHFTPDQGPEERKKLILKLFKKRADKRRRQYEKEDQLKKQQMEQNLNSDSGKASSDQRK